MSVFTDEDLKRLKEAILYHRKSAQDYIDAIPVDSFEALLARLQAAEVLARKWSNNIDYGSRTNRAIERWRKSKGEAND